MLQDGTKDTPIVIVSLSKRSGGELTERLRVALRKIGPVLEAFTVGEANTNLHAKHRPRAIVIADGDIIGPDARDLLLTIKRYVSTGGTVVFAEWFSLSTSALELCAIFQDVFGLPWEKSDYGHESHRLNTECFGLSMSGLKPVYGMKAVRLKNVSRDTALYQPASHRGSGVCDAAIAFSRVGHGYVGFVGDVNSEEGSTLAVVAMCGGQLPEDPTLLSPAAKKPISVVVLSLWKERYLDYLTVPLTDTIKKHGELTIVESKLAFTRYLERKGDPSTVLVVDAAIGDPEYKSVLNALRGYAKRGGTVVCTLNVSNGLEYDTASEFFAHWNLPWDVGTYCRTTVHQNSAFSGIPTMSTDGLDPYYSIKSVSLINVSPEHCLYNPSPTSRLESYVFAPTTIPIDPKETPAAFAPYGQGYFGYVGDVNAEINSLKIALVVCGVPVSSMDPKAKRNTTYAHLSSDGEIEDEIANEQGPPPGTTIMHKETIRQAGRESLTGTSYGEAPLPPRPPPVPSVPPPRAQEKMVPKRSTRPREVEVEARRAKRTANTAVKKREADRLKNIGNERFKQQDWRGAISNYQAAVRAYSSDPVYFCNMAAAHLKLQEFQQAEAVAHRAVILNPAYAKARFRRGLARIGLGKPLSAIQDFELCLQLEPNNKEVQQVSSAERDRYSANPRPDPGFSTEEEEALHYLMGEGVPAPDQKPMMDMEGSDSSDYEHDGNGIPCRSYNHEGCKKGRKCKYSHAYTDKAIRDELGRNVCVAYLVDACNLGEDVCRYSHSKEYMPEEGWWFDSELLPELREWGARRSAGDETRHSYPEAEIPFQTQFSKGVRIF